MAILKIAGAWSGAIEVDLETCTVPVLRQQVAIHSNCEPESINLICAGKLLKDDDPNQNLSQVGLKHNSKILANRVSSSHRQELLAEEERSTRLARIKAATVAMAERHADGSLLHVDNFDIELEDQSGSKVNLGSETDQRAVMMGLMLHAKSKQFLKRGMFKDALEVLTMAEESFSLCNPDLIELVDNIPMLQIDIVWCYFMLRDVKWLSQAGVKLASARQGIERTHGKDSSRVRLLQPGHIFPELALYLRLELLEGVMAYYSGQYEKSRSALNSAQAKFLQLQVPEESLSMLVSMGYKERQAERALRMSNQNISMAIDFLTEEAVKREKRIQEDIQRAIEIKEQKRYGMTPLRKAVDIAKLKELVFVGYDKALAAEALRRNENDQDKALDDLTNPETNAAIQVEIESRKRKRHAQAADAAVEQLVAMGFERSRVVAAVQAFGTRGEALTQLLAQQADPSLSVGPNLNTTHPVSPISTSSPNNNDNIGGQASTSNGITDEQRDMEMERELASEIEKGDVISDYDIDVTKEGEAIKEFIALLDAQGKDKVGDKASTSH